MITKRRRVRFPIRSRTTLGVPFGQHPALSARRRQPLLAQKRSSNKPQLSYALTRGEYRQAAGAIAEAVIRSVELIVQPDAHDVTSELLGCACRNRCNSGQG